MKDDVALNALKEFLLTPFRLIATLMGIYQAVRTWFAARFAEPKVAAVIKGGIVITFFAWVAIWAIAGEKDRNRLTEAVMGLWGRTEKVIDQKQQNKTSPTEDEVTPQPQTNQH